MATRLLIGIAVGATVLTACGSSAGSTPPGSADAIVSSAPVTEPSSPQRSVRSLAPPSPTAAATVPSQWTTYTSKRYAYSVDYPSDWTSKPAKQDWPPDGDTYPEDYAIDRWDPPPSPMWVLMFVSSVLLDKGEVASERLAKVDRDNARSCQLSAPRSVTVDGVTARRQDGKCFGNDFISEVAVVKSGRFYLVYVLSGFPLGETTLATFDHFLGSFRFGS